MKRPVLHLFRIGRVGPEAEKPTNTFTGVTMRFFVLQQDKQVVQVDDYLKKADVDPEFARFIRREALGEILVQQSNDKPSLSAVRT
jgi:hypothetical protein